MNLRLIHLVLIGGLLLGTLTASLADAALKPVIAAIHANDLATVKRLITRQPALVKRRPSEGQFMLVEAVYARTPAIAEWLIQHGCDVNASDNHGCSPLWKAALASRGDMVAMLLAHGADPNTSNRGGDSTLVEALVADGNVKMLQTILKAGGRLERPYLLYGAAVCRPDAAMVRFLYELGVRPPFDDPDDDTLAFAAARGTVETVQFLLSKGGAREAQDAFVSAHTPQIAAVLLPLGAGIDKPDRKGRTALEKASADANPAMVAWLLEHGAAVNLHSPLLLACRGPLGKKTTDCALLLIDHGADVNAKKGGEDPPLIVVCRALDDLSEGNPETLLPILKSLLDHGADVKMVDGSGAGLLQLAARCRRAVMLLEQHGASR